MFSGEKSAPIGSREVASRGLTALLLLLHAGLAAWATVGLAEWLLPEVPWPPVANPRFPRWLLLAHWSAVLAAAVTFLGGWLARWQQLPRAMIAGYGAMTIVCVVETFGYLTDPLRFVAMGLEVAAYVAIVVALHRAPGLRERFAEGGSATMRR